MNSIVEVGCWKGAGTHALLSGCRGTVYAVDHFQGSADPADGTHGTCVREEFFERLGHFENLQVLEMASVEAATHFADSSVDMVFIDAGHRYIDVLQDLQAWACKARRLVCGHDVSGLHGKKVRKALNDYGRPWEVAMQRIWVLT